MGMQLQTVFHQPEEAPPPISLEIQLAAALARLEEEYNSFLEHPFLVTIEMYISERQQTAILPADNDTIPPVETFMPEIVDLLRQEIAQLFYISLKATVSSNLTASFVWARLGHNVIIPTVLINVPENTVADWADLESKMRWMLGKAMGRSGLVIDVQFQII